MFGKTPSNNRDWSPDQALLPRVERSGDSVRITHIRNCRYRTESDYDVRYYDKAFDLAALRRLWFVRVPFSPLFAHAFVSFEFDGGEFLGISIEIRKKRGDHFSPLKGCFREFELMYVVGDERDLIGLRAVYRRDPVYLYPMHTSEEFARRCFLAMLERAESLRARPEFYNSIFNNCMTNLYADMNRAAPGSIPCNVSTVVPSRADRLLQRIGFLKKSVPIETLRARHLISERARRYADYSDFSLRIRG